MLKRLVILARVFKFVPEELAVDPAVAAAVNRADALQHFLQAVHGVKFLQVHLFGGLLPKLALALLLRKAQNEGTGGGGDGGGKRRSGAQPEAATLGRGPLRQDTLADRHKVVVVGEGPRTKVRGPRPTVQGGVYGNGGPPVAGRPGHFVMGSLVGRGGKDDCVVGVP